MYTVQLSCLPPHSWGVWTALLWGSQGSPCSATARKGWLHYCPSNMWHTLDLDNKQIAKRSKINQTVLQKSSQINRNTPNPLTVLPFCAGSPFSETVTSSVMVEVLLSSLLYTNTAACQLSEPPGITGLWLLARTPSVPLWPPDEFTTWARSWVSPKIWITGTQTS